MKKTHFLCPCFRPLHRLRGFRFGSGRHLRHYEPYLRCYRNHNQHQTPTDLAFNIGLAGSGRYNKKRVCDILDVTDSWCAVQDSNL